MTDRSIPPPCTPARPCDQHRTCHRCACLRQAHIADQAELIEAAHGPLWLSVLVPTANTMAAIKALRASIIRRGIAPAGLWTVETGTKFGALHLNILSPKPHPLKIPYARTYSERIQACTRVAAAYISKQTGMPTPQQYAGHLYGTWGRIHDILTAPDAPPLVQGAALEHILTGKQGPTPPPPAPYCSFTDTTPPTLTREQYAAIARRHLPNLYAAAAHLEHVTILPTPAK